MSIPSIGAALPCFESYPKEQTFCSLIFRITLIALGAMIMAAGILTATCAIPFTSVSWLLLSGGFLLIITGVCLKCIKKENPEIVPYRFDDTPSETQEERLDFEVGNWYKVALSHDDPLRSHLQPGLTLLAKCKNENCEKHNQPVYYNKNKKKQYSIPALDCFCPNCNCKVRMKITDYFLFKCHYKFEANETATEKIHRLEGEATTTHYVRFNPYSPPQNDEGPYDGSRRIFRYFLITIS